jgi:hypothetical protein
VSGGRAWSIESEAETAAAALILLEVGLALPNRQPGGKQRFCLPPGFLISPSLQGLVKNSSVFAVVALQIIAKMNRFA